jgi:hypothetical protein
MTLKQQQEFETWLGEKINLVNIASASASPSDREVYRQVENCLEMARSKFLELSREAPPVPETSPKPAPAVRPIPKPKTKSSR